MSKPLNQRTFHAFLSHSSRDKSEFVDELYLWLTKKAGLSVWYDRQLQAGQLAANLSDAIENCRAGILVLSEHSLKSEWVGAEANSLQYQVLNVPDFRLLTIRLSDVEARGFLKSSKHIDVFDGRWNVGTATLLVESLFGGRDVSEDRPVYLSRGWRAAERDAAEKISDALQFFGFRITCDWPDQARYDAARVQDIMAACGGLVAVLPLRENGTTSSYILREIHMATELGLPCCVFLEQGVTATPPEDAHVVAFTQAEMNADASTLAEQWSEALEGFSSAWRKPRSGMHVFLGHSLEDSVEDMFMSCRRMLSRLTGLPVKVGGIVGGSDAQAEITQLISAADFCVIDITNSQYENLPEKINFGLNSCIEAGIALGAGRPLYLTCRTPRRSPPFMFRNKQIWFYSDGVDLVAILRQIAARHRRYVVR